MGCSQSLNSEVQLNLTLNTPIFKSEKVSQTVLVRTTIRDLCKQVIHQYQENEYKSHEISYKILFRGKTFTMNDCISLYDLRLEANDVIQITGHLLDTKKLELTLKICYQVPKTIVCKYQKNTLIKDLLGNEHDFRIIRGNIELDPNDSLEDYEICNNSKLIVLVPNVSSEDVQVWKIKKNGLVLEANCMNSSCAAYKQRICLNLGLGEFDLTAELGSEHERECLNCGSVLGKISKIGFCHCIATVWESETEEKRIEVKDYIEYSLPREKLSFKVKTEKI